MCGGCGTQAPAARSGPPANLTLETVDTAAVAAESQPIVGQLTLLYQACAAAAAAPAKKKESEDNSKCAPPSLSRL